MSRKIEVPQFITAYGPKILDSNEFNSKMDTTDQRCALVDPKAFFDNIMMDDMRLPATLVQELDEEDISDFDNDDYEYEDRTDYGVDVAEFNHLTGLAAQEEAAPEQAADSKVKPADNVSDSDTPQ